MTTIKIVKNKKNNKTYRVRKLYKLNHYTIDVFDVEVDGFRYVACADTESDLNRILDSLILN
jgi:hypothetical protein